MKKTTRTQCAHETVEITRSGSYTAPSGRVVNIVHEIDAAKRGTRIYDSTFPGLGALLHPLPNALLEVTPESTFAALRRLSDEGEGNIGCLNFASAKNPGGGFLNGAEAQEEALSRASALYECLLCAPDYYERNRANRSCLYLDLVIASPKVPFFRDDEGVLLERSIFASVITAPAPNAGAVTRNEPQKLAEIEPTLQRRAELLLYAAAREGVESLVLGAWGCGVFRNEPRLVAKVFGSLLKPGGMDAMLFKRVIFAVFDPTATGPNYRAFLEEFA